MSRALAGAVEIAAGAALLATGVGGALGANLVIMGVGTEISALTRPPGINTTVRQSAAPRQIIYGTMRVGGVEVFESTTGSSLDQYNIVVVIATHEVWAIQNLYLDGRQVFWAGPGTDGYQVRNGVGFGGGGDGQQHTGPMGERYQFDNAVSGHSGVYCAWRAGDQAAGDFLGELQANDGRWGPDANGNVPSLMGCAYAYIKVEFDTNVFPQKPDIKFDVAGKAVLDPRSGQTAYSNNWALVVADILTDTEFGLGAKVNHAQLIAAANICDEMVYSSVAAAYENRYTANYAWTTDKSVGDVLNELMKAAEGRIAYVNGEWFIFPGAYVGPTGNFDSSQLIDAPVWSSQRAYRDKFNRVRGTYVAPNYPFNLVGDQYTSPNGYNDQGQAFDTWGLEFQSTNYPEYAADTLHGYASDQYLAEDGGIELVETLDLQACCSLPQAQRVAKIHLLRNRQQGSGTLTFGVEGLTIMPNDTITMTFPQRGWVEKLLEVTQVQISIESMQGAPAVKVVVSVNETDPSVYAWNATDELTVYALPAVTNPGLYYTTAPPTNMELVSSAATAILQPDGTVIPRIQVTWNTPADVRVTGIQVQYQRVTDTAWTDAGVVSVLSNISFIAPVIAGQQYNVRIASLRSNGAMSAWVELSGFTASLVLSVQTQVGLSPNSLFGEAYTDGTAAIDVNPFTALIGSLQVPILPAGPYQITGLAQQTLYYVYYVDPNAAGGAITPVATTSISDFAGKLGYWLIGSIVTPYAATGGGSGSSGKRYYPSAYQDVGYRSTGTPTAAFDGDLTTYALVSGSTSSTTTSYGDCIFQGDPATTLTATSTLTITASVAITGPGGTATIVVNYTQSGSSVSATLLSASASAAQQTYTASIPAGVALNTVTVEVQALPAIIDSSTGSPSPGGTITRGGSWNPASVGVNVYEVYIQA